MKFLIYIKNKSERIPDKNFIDLKGLPLWQHLIYTLAGQEVFIDTDSKRVIQDTQDMSWVTAYNRLQKHIDLETDQSFAISPALLMIERFLDEYVDDVDEIIITPHVTSPFITLETMIKASTQLNDIYDSVQACTVHHEFAYYKNQPINFDPDVVQKTQDLVPIVMGNGAFFIFTKRTFKQNNNRTGRSPYLYPISYPESIEIDNIEDYKLAQVYI
jgi:CMP-N-acetylneuraminic acid synthetase